MQNLINDILFSVSYIPEPKLYLVLKENDLAFSQNLEERENIS